MVNVFGLDVMCRNNLAGVNGCFSPVESSSARLSMTVNYDPHTIKVDIQTFMLESRFLDARYQLTLYLSTHTAPLGIIDKPLIVD